MTVTKVKTAEHPSVEQRAAHGKAARAQVPREAHGEWRPEQRVQKPLELLAEQAQTRVPELVPIRYGRMSASPFSYYRGAALPMAADLATSSRTDLNAQLCGDAHLSNFGGFAAPDRTIVFDVNDFDETSRGPFEWDLKRLAASLEVAGRDRSFDPKDSRKVAVNAVSMYQRAIQTFAAQSNLDVWYSRLDVQMATQQWGGDLSGKALKRAKRNLAHGESKNELKARSKLARMVEGKLRFVSEPPLLVPLEELFNPDEAEEVREAIEHGLRGYRHSLVDDRRHLLESYEGVDVARKVVGVGSVGTRAWVALFVGRDTGDTLILQVKEAEQSVLERFLTKSRLAQHGERVVAGQRLMQAASDIFLGWWRIPKGADGRSHDYYVRQLWDSKLSADVDSMDPRTMAVYAQMCGWSLARAHARSGDAVAISSYIGSGRLFVDALADFARAYADQNEADYDALVDAIKAGTVIADPGV